MTKPRTQAEFKAEQTQREREWVQSVLDSKGSMREICRDIGALPESMYRRAKRLGIDIPDRLGSAAKAKAQEQRRLDRIAKTKRKADIAAATEKARELARLARAKTDLERQLAPLVKEGFTRQQAMNSLKNRLGLTV